MDTKSCVELNFTSETGKVREVVQRILNFIDQYNPAKDVRSDLRLVFSELLYNAVIHGNDNNPEKKVGVRVEVVGTVVCAQVRDEGTGFNYKQAIKTAKSEEALLYEHNRGIILVSSLTDRLSYNKAGNVIKFEKRLK